jgi:hypothetical protein
VRENIPISAQQRRSGGHGVKDAFEHAAADTTHTETWFGKKLLGIVGVEDVE